MQKVVEKANIFQKENIASVIVSVVI